MRLTGAGGMEHDILPWQASHELLELFPTLATTAVLSGLWVEMIAVVLGLIRPLDTGHVA
jgi:hypothetical protein